MYFIFVIVEYIFYVIPVSSKAHLKYYICDNICRGVYTGCNSKAEILISNL